MPNYEIQLPEEFKTVLEGSDNISNVDVVKAIVLCCRNRLTMLKYGNNIAVGTKYRWNTRKMSESERFAHMFDKSIGLVRKWSEIKVGLMVA